MPYLGNPPAERFTSFDYQDLTGGSGTSFTLDNAVGNPQEIEVFVNNVRQEPGVAYTVSGTALTMTGSIATTDDFYVVFQGKAIQTATHPSDRALTATDGTFTGDASVTGDLTVDTSTLKVDSTNNRVGIGTTSPAKSLSINTSSNTDGIDIGGGGTVYTSITSAGTDTTIQATNAFAINTNGANERLRIDNTGHVGINNTTPGSYLEGELVVGNSTKDQYINVVTGTGNAAGLCFQDTTGTSIVGGLRYTHSDNTLQSWTNGAERTRINSFGDLLVACTTTDSNSSSGVRMFSTGSIHATRTNEYAAVFRRSSSDGGVVLFRRDANNVGGINVTSSSTSYATSSDHRLKENVADMTGAIDRVKQLAPKRFNFIVDADTTVDGFLAHEAQTVVPEAVIGTHNEVDDDGNAVMQGIDQSKLVPLLTGALKEAIAKIEALETENSTQATQIADLITRVTALEDA